MNIENKHLPIGRALRDFFLAENAAELKVATQSLFDLQKKSLPESMDWEALEFAFNRLFIGPMEVIAPPFASVYLDDERYVMGQSTREMRDLYHLVGLTSPWENRIPDDHISIELDACLHFHQTIESTGYSELQPIYFHMLNHLDCWVPQFIEQMKTSSDLPEPLQMLGELLLNWLEVERDWLRELPVPEFEPDFLKEERRL